MEESYISTSIGCDGVSDHEFWLLQLFLSYLDYTMSCTCICTSAMYRGIAR